MDSLPENGNSDENLVAAFISSAAGALIFLLLPIIVGWLADRYVLNEQMVGSVVSIYFLGFLVTSVLAFIFFLRIDRQRILQMGYLMLVPGILSIGYVPSTSWLMLALCVCGLASGLLYGTGLSIVANTRQTEKNFGGMLATQQAFALVLIYCLPVWVLPAFGYEAVWTLLAAVVFLMSFSLVGYKNVFAAKPSTGEPPAKSIGLGLSYLFLHFCLLSAVWAFIERLGIKRGFESDDIALALALSLVGGFAGAIAAALLGNKLGRSLPHLLTTILFVTIFISFMADLGWSGFLTSVILFSVGWSYCLAYQMASIGNLSDRFAVLIPGVQGTAAMIAPLLGGWIITVVDYNGLMLTASVAVLLSGFGFMLQSDGAVIPGSQGGGDPEGQRS